MANYLYVDNSNVWIEGKHVSAVRLGYAPDVFAAQNNKICDHAYKLDFGRLFEFAGGKRDEVGRAALFGSRPPPNDSLWNVAKAKGFEVVVFDRNFAGKEKQVDGAIVTAMMADSYERMRPGKDEFTLVAGDADYVPTIKNLRDRDFEFHVVFWHHASSELKRAATKFIALDKWFEHLRLT
jgi:hypothetical protein